MRLIRLGCGVALIFMRTLVGTRLVTSTHLVCADAEPKARTTRGIRTIKVSMWEVAGSVQDMLSLVLMSAKKMTGQKKKFKPLILSGTSFRKNMMTEEKDNALARTSLSPNSVMIGIA